VDMDYGTVQEALEDNQTSHQDFGVRVFLRTV
jgi:hypothetical protein